MPFSSRDLLCVESFRRGCHTELTSNPRMCERDSRSLSHNDMRQVAGAHPSRRPSMF